MTFLQRQRTTSYKYWNKSETLHTPEQKGPEKRLPDLPPAAAGLENIPQSIRSTKSVENKQNGLLKRVGSIFSLRKRPNIDLQLVYNVYNQNPRRPSYDVDSLHSSPESEAEIRCPSGLGSAVSIISKRSLPPSPFYPPNGSPYDPMSSQPRLLKRAFSSPNLLRSFSLRVKGKNRGRRGSEVALPAPSAKHYYPRRNAAAVGSHLPESIISLILAHLPPADIASCATVSRIFCSAARSALYTQIDTSSINTTNLENLISVLSSRSELAELVMSFTCPEWPPFFISATNQGTRPIQQIDTRLTAMFTLALERMYNLTSLTLPSFDMSFVAHHTSFGLKSISFLSSGMSEAEMKGLLAWLDGQVNISTLRFPNLFDIENTTGPTRTNTRNDSTPHHQVASDRAPSLSPPRHGPNSTYPSPSPSPTPSILTQNPTLFSSPTLLPHLTTLHATPSLVLSLCSPLENSSIRRRPLQSVLLNINSTLYDGLRPASLMSAVSGISHLVLRFSSTVDKRSFEKVVGAAGAALGSSAEDNGDPFVVIEKNGLQSITRSGLRTLEISFQTPGAPGRGEVRGTLLLINSIVMSCS